VRPEEKGVEREKGGQPEQNFELHPEKGVPQLTAGAGRKGKKATNIEGRDEKTNKGGSGVGEGGKRL